MADGQAGRAEAAKKAVAFRLPDGTVVGIHGDLVSRGEMEIAFQLKGGAVVTAVRVDRFAVTHGRAGFRAEFAGDGAAYAVKLVDSNPVRWQWVVLTARNRELEIERADVDATTAEMDAAELAVLDAERGS